MKTLARALLLITMASATDVSACSRIGPVVPEDVVLQADLIIRATALEYIKPPADPNRWTTGEPESEVVFRVEEIVKGSRAPKELLLPAYLGVDDDFNELPVPYRFVRSDGRGGSCFANRYKQGAEYLLILKLFKGRYTVDWYALGPTNEQLRSAEDPWLEWVRAQASGKKSDKATAVDATARPN